MNDILGTQADRTLANLQAQQIAHLNMATAATKVVDMVAANAFTPAEGMKSITEFTAQYRKVLAGLSVLVAAILLIGCDGTPGDTGGDAGNAARTDSGSAAQSGTCPVPGPDQTSTPATAGKLGYLVSNGPVVCPSSFATDIVYKGIPCSDIAGNLKTPANTPALPYGPCCVAVVQDTTDSRVTPGMVMCGDLLRNTPGAGDTTQYALCSTSGTFLGWVCPPIENG